MYVSNNGGPEEIAHPVSKATSDHDDMSNMQPSDGKALGKSYYISDPISFKALNLPYLHRNLDNKYITHMASAFM